MSLHRELLNIKNYCRYLCSRVQRAGSYTLFEVFIPLRISAALRRHVAVLVLILSIHRSTKKFWINANALLKTQRKPREIHVMWCKFDHRKFRDSWIRETNVISTIGSTREIISDRSIENAVHCHRRTVGIMSLAHDLKASLDSRYAWKSLMK